MRPPYLVLDEPTAQLHPGGSGFVGEALRRLAGTGTGAADRRAQDRSPSDIRDVSSSSTAAGSWPRGPAEDRSSPSRALEGPRAWSRRPRSGWSVRWSSGGLDPGAGSLRMTTTARLERVRSSSIRTVRARSRAVDSTSRPGRPSRSSARTGQLQIDAPPPSRRAASPDGGAGCCTTAPTRRAAARRRLASFVGSRSRTPPGDLSRDGSVTRSHSDRAILGGVAAACGGCRSRRHNKAWSDYRCRRSETRTNRLHAAPATPRSHRSTRWGTPVVVLDEPTTGGRPRRSARSGRWSRRHRGGDGPSSRSATTCASSRRHSRGSRRYTVLIVLDGFASGRPRGRCLADAGLDVHRGATTSAPRARLGPGPTPTERAFVDAVAARHGP